MFYSVPLTFQQAVRQSNKHNIHKKKKTNQNVQDRICFTIAGLPNNCFVLQRNQTGYSTFIGLVT